ncbi:MAG: hypothetical protein CMN30_25835 [Sandaracinus sp.]|nr:hypothetical protein [Sandaracinus sp.]
MSNVARPIALRAPRTCGQARNVRSVRLLALFAALASVGAPDAARAQSYGQYLVVLDDSGSMDRSDPQRLVVMAAAALAGALDDADQLMLVGLNELASGAVNGPRFRSPAQILEDRGGPAGERALTDQTFARLATHDGQTPCAQALDRARAILNDVASAGAPQTLLLLTDGACNGALEPAARWLGGVRAQHDERFRFVLLVRRGSGRPSAQLVDYAEATGWQGNTEVAFDARALLRAFAEVLSFSRGLTYDEGGRVGLERTFAGARSVRALAVHEGGASPLALTLGDGRALEGGPTYRSLFGWSLRSAPFEPTDTPVSVSSPTGGAEVLVIPVYGKLRTEAVIGPCGDAPALPWEHELAVRAGHPACAWARLVGDAEETIVPGKAFDFAISLCEDDGCAAPATMQPGRDGVFHAQLGQLPEGRHERIVRAAGGALAFPVEVTRGARSVAFGIHRVSLADAPETPVHRLELGERPIAHPTSTALVLHGSFPAGSRARIRCEVHGAAIAECLRCVPETEEVELQDQLRVELDVRATPYCQALQVGSRTGTARVDAELIVEPIEDGPLVPHHLPIAADLRYVPAEDLALTLTGGDTLDQRVSVPAPPRAMAVTAAVRLDEADRLRARAEAGELAPAEDGASVGVHLEAQECCSPREYPGVLRLEAEGSALEIPTTITVADPGWWICPGQKILRWTLAVLGVLLLSWIVRGFLSPHRFREGAVLLYAESHDALLEIRDSDDGHRPFRRFPETKRGFRRNAALHLGGPRAPLPSLKRMPDDARLVATGGGGAVLVVEREDAVERFTEADGWQPIPTGQHPVASRLTLRRAGEVYLEVRP